MALGDALFDFGRHCRSGLHHGARMHLVHAHSAGDEEFFGVGSMRRGGANHGRSAATARPVRVGAGQLWQCPATVRQSRLFETGLWQ